MLTPASVFGSTVHMLQREIYYSSRDYTGWPCYLVASDINFVLNHLSFKHCLEFFMSLYSEVSFLTWYMIQASCIYNPCLLKQWHKSRRQEFLRGAADCQCGSNEVSLPLAVHSTRGNQTTWTSKTAKLIWMV